jgi:hypothetical protein
MERNARMQHFYIDRNCTEIVIDYATACGLINLLNRNLKQLANEHTSRLAIVFISNTNKLDSPINEEVLSNRILAAIESKIVSQDDCSISINDHGLEEAISLYFNI